MEQMDQELHTVSIFRNWVEIASSLKNDSERGRFYHAICCYSLNGEIPELKGMLQHFFLLIKPVIDKSNTRRKSQQKGIQKRLQSVLQNSLQNSLQSSPQNTHQTGSPRIRVRTGEKKRGCCKT